MVNRVSYPILALLVLGTAGCAVPREAVQPEVAVPSAFTQVPASASAVLPEQMASWWTVFGDSSLDAQVALAQARNRDLLAARARVRAARAMSDVAESLLWPSVDAVGGASRTGSEQQHTGLYDPGMTPVGPVPPFQVPPLPRASTAFAGLAAQWEIDVMGGRQSDVAAAQARDAATQAQARGLAILVAADVVQNHLEAQAIAARQAVLQRGIDTAAQLERYAQARFEAGQAQRADVERAHAQRQALQAQVDALAAQRALCQRRLAVLTGQAPQEVDPAQPGPARPGAGIHRAPVLPQVLPSEVLAQRPDVAAAWQLAQMRAAELGSAQADQWPHFVLGFTGVDGHLSLSGYPATSGLFGGIGLGVSWPLFNAGRLAARERAQAQLLDASVRGLEQSLLQALQDVDDAYQSTQALDTRVQWLDAAWRSAAASAGSLDGQHREGAALLQPVLEARLQALSSEDALLQAQTARALAWVGVYKALGWGGA